MMKRFYQWLYFGSINSKRRKTNIIKVRSWRSFLIEDVNGRSSVYIDWLSPVYLFFRLIGLERWYYNRTNKIQKPRIDTSYYSNNDKILDTSSGVD